MYTKYKIVPFCPCHFVRTILSVYHFVHTLPFCPYHFVRYHFVRYHFVRSPFSLKLMIPSSLLYNMYTKYKIVPFCPCQIRIPISNFSSVRRSPTMRPQQDSSRSFFSCCCPPLLSCSFLVPLGLLSHYLSTSLVVFLCFLFPPLVRIALLPVVCFPPS